jgi:hypothetical protein
MHVQELPPYLLDHIRQRRYGCGHV